MIQFPETAETEWNIVADAANADRELRARIERATQVENRLEKLRIDHEARVALEQELNADQTPALEMMTLSSYQNNAALAPSDLIEGVLKDNGLCIMTGPSGSGKSTLALQALHSLMTGDDWLGQHSTKLNGAVGIVSYDMDGPLVLDWMSGYPNIDPSKINLVNAYKRGNPLNVTAMRAQIANAWKAANVEVIVVDSFSASFFGQNQNDIAETMSHYRDLLKFALTECGARALIVIAHSTTSSPGKIRGASTHHDVADSIVGVNKNETTGERDLHMAKYRSHRGVQGTMSHQMGPVILSTPDPVTNLVDLDIGGMQLAGMAISATVSAAVFPDIPDATEPPDTDSELEDEV